jgi:nucleoside-diphosphate-sugar epimerase
MNEKVAILGANGLIGSAVTALFAKKGADVVCCAKEGGPVGDEEVTLIDLTRTGALSKWLGRKRVSTVVYLASAIPSSFENLSANLFETNLKMHREVLSYWEKTGCHLIFASSCSVYGSEGPLPWREKNAPNPENFYSISKLAGELMFDARSAELPLTILRINAPYGFPVGRKTVVNIFMESALDGADLILHGTGKRVQDLLHVRDIAAAFWLAHSKKKCGTYNIASGKTVTMRQLAEMIVDCTHSSSKIVKSGKPDPKEGVKVAVDISRARRELGFRPRYDLAKGLEALAEEYAKAMT